MAMTDTITNQLRRTFRKRLISFVCQNPNRTENVKLQERSRRFSRGILFSPKKKKKVSWGSNMSKLTLLLQSESVHSNIKIYEIHTYLPAEYLTPGKKTKKTRQYWSPKTKLRVMQSYYLYNTYHISLSIELTNKRALDVSPFNHTIVVIGSTQVKVPPIFCLTNENWAFRHRR